MGFGADGESAIPPPREHFGRAAALPLCQLRAPLEALTHSRPLIPVVVPPPSLISGFVLILLSCVEVYGNEKKIEGDRSHEDQ